MESSEIEIHKYEPRYWYPHLSPAEARLWDKFVKANPDAFQRVAYDVKVGTVPDFVLQHDDPAIREQSDNYRYKIDVVGLRDNDITIIELKQSATMRAIGQVKGYRELFKREYKPSVEPKCIIMTDVLMPDMGLLAAAEGVQVFVV